MDAEAIHEFLKLEQSGWKRGRGALAATPQRGTFVRAMLRDFANDGDLRVAKLISDGRPIAIGLVLVSGDRAFSGKLLWTSGSRVSLPACNWQSIYPPTSFPMSA